MNTIMSYLEGIDWPALVATTLRIALILVLVRVIVTLLGTALRRFEQRLVARDQAVGEVVTEASKRAETLVRLLRQGAMVLLWLVTALVVLRELGIEIAPILAGAGIAGVAVGFGAQSLVRDVISGFFMILENQVRVGDVAIVNGTGGLVEQVNFRTIVLRDLAGVVHIFPNGAINTLSNVTQEWSAYVFNVGIDYQEDPDRAMEIMRAVGVELRTDPQYGPLINEDIEIFGIDNFEASAVTIKGRIKTRPIRQWDVGREYRRRLKKAFDKAGVQIPFPQRTLSFAGLDKPLEVSIVGRQQ